MSGEQSTGDLRIPERIGFCGFHTGTGGIGHVMINLINGCIAAGVSVDLLIADRSSPHLGAIDPRVNIVEIGSSFLRSSVPKTAAYLRTAQPDWVLSNREKSHRFLVLARRLAGSRARIALRIGNSLTETLNKRNRLKRTIRRGLIRWAYGYADLIIVNSHGLAADVRQHAGVEAARIRVLNNPTFSPELLREAATTVEHPWLIDKTAPVLLGVGRLTGQKDFPTLIRAVGEVARRQPVRLIILGEGKDRDELEALVRELDLEGQVDLPGYVANPFAYMARADLFVLSSAWEGSPNVLIQALSVGCPVVATDCPEGPREILQGGRVAPLVPVGDIEAMAAAIRQVLAAPPAAETLQQAAEPFAVPRAVAAYLQAFEEFSLSRSK